MNWNTRNMSKSVDTFERSGIASSISKCEFHMKRTKSLGFIVTTEGIEVDPEKLQ